MTFSEIRGLARHPVPMVLGISVAIGTFFLGGAVARDPAGIFGATTAAWVQAIGSIAAVVGAAWIAGRDSAERRALAAQARREAHLAARRELEGRYAAAVDIVEAGKRLLTATQVALRTANPQHTTGAVDFLRQPIMARIGAMPPESLQSVKAWEAVGRCHSIMLALEISMSDLAVALEGLDAAAIKIRCEDCAQQLEGWQPMLEKDISFLHAELQRVLIEIGDGSSHDQPPG